MITDKRGAFSSGVLSQDSRSPDNSLIQDANLKNNLNYSLDIQKKFRKTRSPKSSLKPVIEDGNSEMVYLIPKNHEKKHSVPTDTDVKKLLLSF